MRTSRKRGLPGDCALLRELGEGKRSSRKDQAGGRQGACDSCRRIEGGRGGRAIQKHHRGFRGNWVVVHTAGIMPLAPIAKGDIESFDNVIATNLRGTFLVMSEAVNHISEGGRIVVFSSSVVAKSFPGYGAYIASKCGVEGLVKVLANELAGRTVTVNAVAPGPVATPLFLKGKSEEQIKEMGKLAPLGRIGEVSDIVGVVAFLVSKDGGWINAQVLRANGGFA